MSFWTREMAQLLRVLVACLPRGPEVSFQHACQAACICNYSSRDPERALLLLQAPRHKDTEIKTKTTS